MQTIEDLDNFHVDNELRALIPTPTMDELRGLVEDIERDGRIINPLVVWKHDDEHTLIDGHNRLDAWESLGNRGVDIPPPDVVVKLFADRDEAKWWMIAHQLHRRNVTKEQRDRLLRELYELAKQDKRDNLNRGTESPKGQSEPSGKSGEKRTNGSTAKKVADATGVSEATVKRAVAKAKPKPVVKQYADTFDTDALDEESTEASIVRDGADRPVPKHMAGQHALAAKINGVATQLDKFKKAVAGLRDEPGGQFLQLTRIESLVKELKGAVREGRYYTDCPTCQGAPKKNCRRCDGHGFIPFARKGVLSQPEKDWLEVTR